MYMFMEYLIYKYIYIYICTRTSTPTQLLFFLLKAQSIDRQIDR